MVYLRKRGKVSRSYGEEMAEEAMWMGMALKEAESALKHGEVPVGCVLVSSEGSVLGRGSNRCNEMRDGTRHAELVAYDEAVNKLGVEEMRAELRRGVRVYVTCEPCIMCAAALVMLGVFSVVYGCANDKFGGCGSVRSIHLDGICGENGEGSIPDVRGGILATEAIRLLQNFYNVQNPNAPQPKRKRKLPVTELEGIDNARE